MSFKRRLPSMGVEIGTDDDMPPTDPPLAPYTIKPFILPFVGALVLQAVSAGDSLISRVALSHNLRPSIYVLYRNILASVVLWAWIFCQRALPPRPSLRTWMWITILAILEPVLDQNLFYAGAEQVPASFSAVIDGITPSATFFCALLFGFERMDFKKRHNRLRLLGAILMIVGAGTMFYRGKRLSLSKSSTTPAAEFDEAMENWMVGPVYDLGSVFCNIFYNLFMGKVLKSYPSPLGLVVYSTSIGVVLDTIIALGVWHDYKTAWKIMPNMSLVAYFYGGIVTIAFGFWLSGKLIQMRGPIFVSSFSPVGLVLVMLIGVLILGETIYLGRILGMVVIVIGLILIQWGEYLGTE